MIDNNEKIKHSKEYWDVKNSGKRLLYKLQPNSKGEFNRFKPTEVDFNALKSLLGYINRVDGKTIYNNQLFAKLYIMELVGQIRENETTIFNTLIFSELSHQLSKPLELFYKAFYQDLCYNQLNRMTKKDFKDEEGKEVLMDLERFRKTFTLELVSSKLDEMINLTLHRRS